MLIIAQALIKVYQGFLCSNGIKFFIYINIICRKMYKSLLKREKIIIKDMQEDMQAENLTSYQEQNNISQKG